MVSNRARSVTLYVIKACLETYDDDDIYTVQSLIKIIKTYN